MPPNSAENLRFLFGLQPEQIAADLASAPVELENLSSAIQAFHASPPEQRTPDQVALCYHRQMLEGHALRLRPNIPEDMGLYFVAYAAQQVADDAAMAAHDQGRLAELSRAMEAIERREGLGPEEYWPLDGGPPDYQALRAESEALFDKIEQSIFLEVLRRYSFDDLILLYENDRSTFEVMKEVGRRLVTRTARKNLEMDVMIEERLVADYGRKAFDLLQKRLRAAGYPTP